MNPVYRELEEIIGRLPLVKLRLLLEYARVLESEEFTPEEMADAEAGKAEIARGEWVDWDELKRELDL
ncbi:MAG: hypothetical protein ACUVTQ_11225 [Desulfotomaculales bacterium]